MDWYIKRGIANTGKVLSHDGGQMVSVLAFYFNDLSLNPTFY